MWKHSRRTVLWLHVNWSDLKRKRKRIPYSWRAERERRELRAKEEEGCTAVKQLLFTFTQWTFEQRQSGKIRTYMILKSTGHHCKKRWGQTLIPCKWSIKPYNVSVIDSLYIYLSIKQLKQVIISMKLSLVCVDLSKHQKYNLQRSKMAGILQQCQKGSKQLVFCISVFVILRSLFNPTAQPFLSQTRPSISGFCSLSLPLEAEP